MLGISRRIGRRVKLLTALIYLFTPSAAHVQEAAKSDTDFAAYPIELMNGSCTPESYSFLGEVIGDARVVALGEASHGTETITEHKQCLIAYLVEQQGFSAVAFEAFYTQMDRANDYIQGEHGDLAPLLGEFSYSIYGTEEVYAFFEWARDYNLSHPAEARFRVFDVDIQANQQTIADVLAFIGRADPAFLAQARSAYRDILALYSGYLGGRLDGVTNAHVRSAETVADHLMSRRETYLQNHSEELVRHALHSARVVVQHLTATSSSASRLLRDEFMAENLLTQRDDKIIFWAHNGHVREGDTPFAAAGTFLAEALGEDYFSVALTFSEGTNQRLIRNQQDFGNCIAGGHTEERKSDAEGYLPNCTERVPPPLQGSLEAFLLEASLANTFSNMRVEENLPPPLTGSIPMRHIGRTSQADEAYQFTNLSEDFDALIFLEEVSAATDLQAGNPFRDDEKINP